MKIAYLDVFAGISGDMLLGAFLDAGLSCDLLRRELEKLPFSGWEITAEKVQKGTLSATQVTVTGTEKTYRHLSDITALIEASTLTDDIKERSKKAFTLFAEAEASVHGVSINEVHFHEVGGVDCIIDIVGTCIALKALGIEKVYASTIPLGRGMGTCDHGTIPFPAPATVLLLKDIPVYVRGIHTELVTPTGACLLRICVDQFTHMPEMTIQSLGYGAGEQDLEIPNCLRLYLGEMKEEETLPYETDLIHVLETDIDDMNPEILAYVTEKLMCEGALDVTMRTRSMKKGRIGFEIRVLCKKDIMDHLIAILFRETTTFGIRISTTRRVKLQREVRVIDTAYGPIAIKIGMQQGCVIQLSPEFEACRKIAESQNVPLRLVYDEASRKAAETLTPLSVSQE